MRPEMVQHACVPIRIPLGLGRQSAFPHRGGGIFKELEAARRYCLKIGSLKVAGEPRVKGGIFVELIKYVNPRAWHISVDYPAHAVETESRGHVYFLVPCQMSCR